MRRTIGRVLRRRGALAGGLAAIALLAGGGLATGVIGLSGDAGERAAAGDLRLDRVGPGTPRSREEPAGRSRARVVQAVPPGGVPRAPAAGSAEEEPPRRILEENAKLRRQLEHLKALEAERRRVSRALTLAAAGFDGPLRLGRGGLAWPVGGGVVSPFGPRWGRLHAGIDIAARTGTPIRAAADGLVVISAPTGGYGNYVCVQHTRRLTSCYAHLSRFLADRGQTVSQGEAIGLVGCTGHCFGEHLHFETWVGGRPVDPMRFF